MNEIQEIVIQAFSAREKEISDELRKCQIQARAIVVDGHIVDVEESIDWTHVLRTKLDYWHRLSSLAKDLFREYPQVAWNDLDLEWYQVQFEGSWRRIFDEYTKAVHHRNWWIEEVLDETSYL